MDIENDEISEHAAFDVKASPKTFGKSNILTRYIRTFGSESLAEGRALRAC